MEPDQNNKTATATAPEPAAAPAPPAPETPVPPAAPAPVTTDGKSSSMRWLLIVLGVVVLGAVAAFFLL
jgi:hypothetical protein